ncbi:eukaryotic membrane protein family-domain-containing protein [Cantharellus anzutake]|uniref:eukaryotic membrane protein family-domain-containing protein n=1 Tax=Cantharellus anzutake TaxID=1750568 RepID=UPI0019059307|nr:eukaryotic membrane protein family-domain-containing protein [Cantharellus anzutake]KAF8335752.1 eukaryotic membrane protein family-domain-containing protein [Cantharellus anzutake]
MDEETHVIEYAHPEDRLNRTILQRRRGTGDDTTFRWAEIKPGNPTEIRRVYASLPSSPAVNETFSRSSTPTVKDEEHISVPKAPHAPFSLWDYLREELLATDFDSHQELKWERVSNFLNVPLAIEKIIFFGSVLCLDTWLYTFTILPIRFSIAVLAALKGILLRSKSSLPPSQKADIIRFLLLVVSASILLPSIDPSKIYHSIRGQDTIKLYVIFNALEIADRLLISIGQDLLDCLFSRSTLLLMSHHIRPTQNTLRPLLFFVLSTFYILSHSMVLVYELTALAVAINAYDNALLMLLLSNQFVEIKGSVFKKFEKDNLFQITCADIVERFQLSLMLFAIALRNMIELSSSEGTLNYAALPKAFQFFNTKSLTSTIFSPVFTVLASELAVDWLKHAFITKFNHIRPLVYERYVDILCRDLSVSQGCWIGRRGSARKHSYVDQSPVVARRLGFASLPLAILAILIGYQSLGMIIANHASHSIGSLLLVQPRMEAQSTVRGWWQSSLLWLSRCGPWVALGIISWICLVTVKLIIGINLLIYASKRAQGMERRAEEDEQVNAYGRPPIGEGKQEQAYNRELKSMLTSARDDAPFVPEIGEAVRGGKDGQGSGERESGGGKRKTIRLEDLTRFTMVKRIW